MASSSTPDNRDQKDIGAVRHLWMSPWTVWVGLRYLMSKKHSRFLSFITLLSILGVMLGVTAMIVVLSVMDGFEDKMKSRLMASDLHILITPTKNAPGFQAGFVPKDALATGGTDSWLSANEKVLSSWPIVGTEAILKAGKKVKGIQLKGSTPARLERLKSQIIESADPQMLYHRGEGGENVKLPGLWVGRELALEMGIIPGDPVTLISPTETEGPMESVPRMKKFAVAGVYRSDIPEQELYTVFTEERSVRSFLRRADVISQWEVTLKEFDDAPGLARELREKLPGFRVQDWIQLNAHLFASLRLERVAMFVILAFIIIVASFNIVTTLTLMVLEKKREISIMKAMGARNGQVAAIFLSEGLLIGAVGVGVGTLLGLILCLILKRYEFIQLPEIYYDRTLPVTFNAGYYIGVATIAFLIVLAACLYPSRRAARINPLEGIRFG